MSSIGEQRGTSRVAFRRAQGIEPSPPPTDGAVRDQLWTALTLLFTATLPLAKSLKSRHPEWPWHTIVQVGMIAIAVAIAGAIVIAWRRAQAAARRVLVAADGDLR